MTVTFDLPPAGTLRPNDAHDPLPYYYHRWLGWLYRHRLQMGLNMLPDGGTRVLEIGVGSGILVPTLTGRYAEYTGTDLILARGLESLVAPGCRATFRSADLLRDDDLPSGGFDAIVCFSVLEHIADSDAAARGLARALAPGGTLITGYPMVSALMTRAFNMIGFEGINDHHVSPPKQIAAALGRVLKPKGRSAFPPAFPVKAALYQCTAWTH
jgi:SAM-dependent methyltransferase